MNTEPTTIQILLVEDNPGDADLLVEMLPAAGPIHFQVHRVGRLAQAVAYLRGAAVDLTVLDLGLPDSSGLDTLKTLVAAVPQVPVVVLTGIDDERTGLAAVKAGAQDYLVKGQVDGPLLARVLGHALERHRNQLRLQESESFLRATLDGLSANIAILDQNGKIIAVNAAWIDFGEANGADPVKTGVGADYLSACNQADGEDAGAAKDFAAAIGQVLAGRCNHYEQDYPCHGPNRRRWFCGRVSPFAGQGPRRAVVAHEDITARKLAEEALKDSKIRLDEAQRIARIGNWEWDVADGAVVWSDETFRLFGLEPGQRVPSYQLVRDLVHPEDLEKWKRALRDAKAGGNFFQLDYRAVRMDGETVWIRNEAEIRRDARGRPLSFCGTAQDVTEKKKAQQDLENSELRLRTILDAQNHHVILLEPGLRVAWANLSACRSAGLDREELIGRACYEIWGDRQDICPECPVREAIRTAKPHSTLYTRSDGSIWRVSGAPVTDAAGRIVSALEIAEDITAQRNLEAQFRHAQKMESIGVLAGGIAHDFNNILSAIIGYNDLSLMEPGLSPKLRDNLEEVARAGQRAKQLVGQILAFSRQMESQMAPVQVHLIVKEVVKLLRAALPAIITVRETIGSHAGVMADSGQIHQVVMNLCTNAFHAMREKGGVLEVDLSEVTLEPADLDSGASLPPGPYLRLRVRDGGIGMTDAIVQQIFDPYFTTKRKGEGSGLGLSVVYGIVQSHHGTIKVASRPGGGSTFDVYLPVLSSTKAAVPAGANPSETAPGGNERILVVDDEPTICKVLRFILTDLGYRVTGFTDPREALEHYRQHPSVWDLVITDMTMPGITGDVLATEMLRLRPDLPVILCTGYSERIDDPRAAALGLRALIFKPVDRVTLACQVRGVLDGRRG